MISSYDTYTYVYGGRDAPVINYIRASVEETLWCIDFTVLDS